MVKGIKFILSASFLSLLTSSVFAQDIKPKNPNDLITVCHQGKKSKVKLCETTRNGKTVRKIFYSDGKLVTASTYYMSGRTAKLIMFFGGNLGDFLVYPDQDNGIDTANGYQLSFKNGKFDRMSNSSVSVYQSCKEDTPTDTKCNELNYFYPSSEPDLHPALALPIENQGLDVLKSNGIKMP